MGTGTAKRYVSDLAGTALTTFSVGPKSTAGTLDFTGLTVIRTYTFPDATGTVALVANLAAYQPLDADLTAIAGANPAANQGVYWTGAGAVSTYSLTAGGRALAAVAGTANTTPYFSAANTVTLQATTAGGRALWNVAGTANTVPYFSAANTVTLQAVSASGRNHWNIGGTSGSTSYLSSTDTWSLTATTASGRNLWNIAGTADNIAYLSALNTWSLTTLTSFARTSLLNQPGASPARDALGVSFQGALAVLTAAESIPDATNTAVPFDAESYDIGGWWASGNPTRLTVPSGVTLVRVTAGVFFNANATGQRLMRLFKNGAAVLGGFSERQDACSASSSDMSASSAVLQVSAGDYFELIVNQNSGAALNLLDAGTGTWMCIEALPD